MNIPDPNTSSGPDETPEALSTADRLLPGLSWAAQVSSRIANLFSRGEAYLFEESSTPSPSRHFEVTDEPPRRGKRSRGLAKGRELGIRRTMEAACIRMAQQAERMTIRRRGR